MSATTLKSALAAGALASAPFLVVVLPFAMLFGVVATEAGLDIAQTMASQFTAVQLLSEGAPVAVVLAAALAVNLRMAMYSAALVPHLGRAPLGLRALVAYLLVDQTYALSEIEYNRRPERPLPEKLAFFFGAALAIVPPWYVVSFAGARLAHLRSRRPRLRGASERDRHSRRRPSRHGRRRRGRDPPGAQAMTASDATIWMVIGALGLGTFLIRFSFLGLIGSRRLPPLALKLLRYTAVAIFPGIALPLVIWATKSVLAGIGAGAAVLALGLWLLPA